MAIINITNAANTDKLDKFKGRINCYKTTLNLQLRINRTIFIPRHPEPFFHVKKESRDMLNSAFIAEQGILLFLLIMLPLLLNITRY